MRTRFVVAASAFLLATASLPFGTRSAAAQGATKTYPPRYGSSAGVSLAIVGGTWAGDGIGIMGHYDAVLTRRSGPGHVEGGGFLFFANTDDDFGPCEREETIVAGAGRVRYVLDVHPVLRPWGGIGMGIYSVDRDDDPCNAPRDDDEIGVGIPISLGLDFTMQSLTVTVNANFHETTAEEDFSHLGVGVAWRF